MKDEVIFGKTYEKSLVGKQTLNSLFCSQRKGVRVKDLPKGAKITTTGGTRGEITGRHTKNQMQIKTETDFDWVDKEALVQEIV